MDVRRRRPNYYKKENIAEVPFAYNIAEKVLDKLRSLTRPAIFKRGLKEVEDTLSSMKGVLLDADEQQAKNLELRDWLRRLKKVCNVADDVLDEIEYEALWQRQQSYKRKVLNFFSSSSPIHFKMKEITERLVKIEAKKGNFHLNERTEERHVKKREDRHLNERTEKDKHSDLIIGREDDKDEIVRRLLMHASDDDENVSVISIVGEGGVGKTTIAQLVYNDERVSSHFQLKLWVYVSRDSNILRLYEKIINSATDINNRFSKNRLPDIVRDKRFLLVLDDVWDPNLLNLLKWNLMVGANGSKIIVTTRSMDLTYLHYTTYQLHQKSLPYEDSLSLFMTSAFREGEMHLYQNLMKIGKELVKRCGGHPLSARILGSLLSSKTDERYWLSIRDSEIWNSKRYESSITSTETEIWNLEEEENNIIPPALRLSYNAMPSYLKQCFSYSSIFKKGSEIIDTELIQMWIAQGFIRPFDENQELEDIGHRYFQELCSLSFFQIVERKPLYCTFKMHDLTRDLALSMAQGECCIVSSYGKNIYKKVQHASLSFTSLSIPTYVLFRGLHNVRTILFSVETMDSIVNDWLKTYSSSFKLLRVLDFSSSHIYELPISIGNLKHLRYLNISNNHSIKMLPTSICKLLNLQSLRLDGCWKLEKLPSDIGNLINLRHLFFTTKQMFLPKEGIGNLKSLRFLGIVECANLKSLGEGMQGLTALRTLLISDCGNLEFLPSSMKHLTALETLSIENCEKLILTGWEEDIQDLRLSLQTLFITRLPQLETLPHWLQGAKDTLQLISIRDCWDLKALPEWLQYLASLQKLEISLCPRLWALPEGMRYLTALRELKIEDCPELNRRCEEGTGKDWHKIAHVPKIVRLERTSEMFRNRKRLLNKLLFLNQ